MGTNLASLLTDTAERHGERTALKLDDTEVSYDFVNEGSARVVGILREHGFEAGDRVGIMLPNVPYFAAIYYGVLRAGGIVVPMNPLLKGREVVRKSRYASEEAQTQLDDKRKVLADLQKSGLERVLQSLKPLRKPMP